MHARTTFPMEILLVEPYFMGSHAAWARGYQRHSRHDVELLTMPGRFWKWRMHGAAITLAGRINEHDDIPDLLLITDMLDVTTLLALAEPRYRDIPLALYFHENQLTYPFPPGTKRDLHYGWINYASALASDAIIFNSAYHRDEFFDELPRLLKHFPDFNNLETIDVVRERSHVLHPGINLQRLADDAPESAGGLSPRGSQPPLILWNQRWEYDKGPDTFFRALDELDTRGIEFRVALAGESFRNKPEEFLAARERFGERIVHFGYAERERYRALLHRSDLVVSTANHEFFGIAIVEAIAAGCFPILPNDLAYPEYISTDHHRSAFYDNFDGLVDLLARYLTGGVPSVPADLRSAATQFGWREQAERYDAFFETLPASTHG